jgi:hypothetical protein
MQRFSRAASRLCLVVSVAAVATLAGCRNDGQSAAADAEPLTRRQKDSLISTLPIPGARGVGGALRASDSLRARADLMDSIARIP